MMNGHFLSLVLLLAMTMAAVGNSQETNSQDKVVKLWPDGKTPGRVTANGPEEDTSKPDSGQVAGKSVIRLGNVAEPTLTVYQPASGANGTSVLICPGGGYHILAMDLEGTEVAEWFNSLGITAFVLKYRVPRGGSDVPIEPLMDAQRAMSLIRARASEWSVQPDRIGVLGFSAGGNLSARLITSGTKRAYEAIDEVDQTASLPNFAMLIYPAYLFDKDGTELVNMPVDEQTPPTFITMAQDDPVDAENALRFALAMKRAKRPAELHVYASGGHGYGLRQTEVPATRWTEPAGEWLKQFTK